jgi:hypothetical protein
MTEDRRLDRREVEVAQSRLRRLVQPGPGTSATFSSRPAVPTAARCTRGGRCRPPHAEDLGITRLSLRWAPSSRAVLDILEALGWEVNLYGVPDLEAFLDASLMLPASVTADFNFPEWRYYGKGSGQVHPGEPARSAAPRRAAALPRSGTVGGRPPPSAE